MTLDSGSNKRDRSDEDVPEKLRDPELHAKVSLLHDEMFEKLAPAADGPIVRTGCGHRGRLIFGDAAD